MGFGIHRLAPLPGITHKPVITHNPYPNPKFITHTSPVPRRSEAFLWCVTCRLQSNIIDLDGIFGVPWWPSNSAVPDCLLMTENPLDVLWKGLTKLKRLISYPRFSIMRLKPPLPLYLFPPSLIPNWTTQLPVLRRMFRALWTSWRHVGFCSKGTRWTSRNC